MSSLAPTTMLPALSCGSQKLCDNFSFGHSYLSFPIGLLTVSWYLISMTAATSLDFGIFHKRQCEPITVKHCTGIGYNFTNMPNMLGSETQDEARSSMDSFMPLINTNCSTQLQFFLCSAHVPMCAEKVDQNIGPCRPLCEKVRQLCEPWLIFMQWQWPPFLDCNQFPEQNNAHHMCMEGPGESRTRETPELLNTQVDHLDRHSLMEESAFKVPNSPSMPLPSSSDSLCCSQCDGQNFVYINATRQCAAKCSEELKILFSKERRDVASIWLACLSGLCLYLSIAAIIVAFTTSYRYRYPEKSVLFIILCYGLSCVGCMIRLFSGATATGCTLYPTKHSDPILLWVTEGLQNIKCTIVFIFIYYFGMAAILWWVMLAITWFLAVGLEWSHEAIEQKTTFYHFPAWVIPALQTIIILVRQVVDADELTGLCSVGFQDTEELLRFVILPQVVYLVVGMALLTVGFTSALHCCQASRGGSGGIGKSLNGGRRLDSVLLKLGIVAAFYVVPGSCLLAALFYEYSYREKWLSNETEPSFEAFILKIVASILYGLVCAAWIVFRTVCQSWNGRTRSAASQKPLATVEDKLSGSAKGYHQHQLQHPQQSAALLYSEVPVQSNNSYHDTMHGNQYYLA